MFTTIHYLLTLLQLLNFNINLITNLLPAFKETFCTIAKCKNIHVYYLKVQQIPTGIIVADTVSQTFLNFSVIKNKYI